MAPPSLSDVAVGELGERYDSRAEMNSELPYEEVTGRGLAFERVLMPRSVSEVIDIVRWARAERRPLYPVSTGRNWGYGSKSPAVAGCMLLDLSQMKRIRNSAAISREHPVALLEPGVTQRQLYDFLGANAPGLTFNVTGSAAETSILGNALDRGVGYLRPRRQDLFGLEVVTGTGEVMSTGFRRLGEGSPLASCHGEGLGPNADGLFFQGNFGVVTSAYFRLQRRPEVTAGLSFAPHDAARFPALIDGLIDLKRDGFLDAVAHVGNRARSHASMRHGVQSYFQNHCAQSAPTALGLADRALKQFMSKEWTGLCTVAGSAAQVRESVRRTRQRLRGIARVDFMTATRLDRAYALAHMCRRWSDFAAAGAAMLSAAKPLHGLALGMPTDVAVEGLLQQSSSPEVGLLNLDSSGCGLLYVCPVLPADGEFIAATVHAMVAVAQRHGHTLYLTVNLETALSVELTANISFDRRDPAAVELAHCCSAALVAEFHARGLEVYRARTDMMAQVVSDSPHWRLLRQLKQAWDPDNIIAPGRYGLQ